MIFEFDCEVCGTHVRTRRSPANTRKPPRFCSQKCNGLSRKGTGAGPTPNYDYDCEACGQRCTVYRSPSAVAPRFCSVTCTGQAQRGDRNPSYSGGRYIDLNGYVHLLDPDHPHADVRGYVSEHRLVMERQIGRLLSRREVVHHRNRNTADNRIENLQLLASQADHLKLHREEDAHASR